MRKRQVVGSDDEDNHSERSRAVTAKKLAAMLSTSRSTALQLAHACDALTERAEEAGVFAHLAARVWIGQPLPGGPVLEGLGQNLAMECARSVQALKEIRQRIKEVLRVIDVEIDPWEAVARIEAALAVSNDRS